MFEVTKSRQTEVKSRRSHIQIVKCFKEWRQVVQMYQKSCKARITTDANSKTIVQILNEHYHDVDTQKT